MIEYLRGDIIELTPARMVMECGGVGYELNISLTTYTAYNGQHQGKIYVFEVIREDAHLLFGFYNKEERELFLLLTSVSGVGPNTARMILSALSPAELCNVISSENVNMLKTVKGIGLKTAQRVIVDLKDKIKTGGAAAGMAGGMPAMNTEVNDEAVAALSMLGFAANASQKVVTAILQEQPSIPVEQVIKLALKRL
jgi:Holliday junction DNA helicase RuvA